MGRENKENSKKNGKKYHLQDSWMPAESLESCQRRESLVESVDFSLAGFTIQVAWGHGGG